jgi:hypothetical protein
MADMERHRVVARSSSALETLAQQVRERESRSGALEEKPYHKADDLGRELAKRRQIQRSTSAWLSHLSLQYGPIGRPAGFVDNRVGRQLRE